MLIRVIYQDFRYDYLHHRRLDEFIESGRVAMFRRRSGWAIVGIDPVRRKRQRYPRELRDRRQPPG
jgi:hypothetical protein